MELHSINADQRLYVMRSGDGFSCYGFDVLDVKARRVEWWVESKTESDDTRKMARRWLDTVPEVGTAEHFNHCANMLAMGRAFHDYTGLRCDADLTPELIGLEKKRVEVTYPDGSKSRFWVGKSGGWIPVHLEIKTRRSIGGAAVYFPAGATVRAIEVRS